MNMIVSSGTGNPANFVGVADGETEYEVGQILLSKANGKYYDVDVKAVISEPAGDPNCSIRVESERLVVVLNAVNADELKLKIATTDFASYEIDWNDGAGYEIASNNITITKTYSPNHTGPVYVRFGINQYPRDVIVTNTGWDIEKESITKLNKYNSVELIKINSLTTDSIDIEKFIHQGSNIDDLYFYDLLNGFGVEWGQYLNRAQKLTYLYYYLTSGVSNPGSLNLDKVRLPLLNSTFYINSTGETLLGSLSDFLNAHQNVSNYVLLADTATSSVALSEAISFKSEMDTFTTNLLDTTEKVDEVLAGLANRSNPSWISSKTVNLGSSAGIPSAQGLTDKATIEAQTGNPVVTVNS